PKAMPKPKLAAQRKPAPKPKPAPAKSKPKPTPKRKPAPRKLSPAGAPDAPATAPGAVAAASLLTYDDHILPIFEANCTACHDPSERKGGLDLTTYATAIRGGGSGKTIVPRDSEGSRLYMLVSHREKPTMPPDDDPIDKAQIDRIRRWIAAGAPENRAAAMAARRRPVVKAPAPKPAKPRPAAAKGPPPVPKNWPALAPAVPKRAVTIKTLAISPRAPLLAVPGHQQVLVLHATTRKLLGVLPFAEGEVEVLRFSADGSRLLVAGGASGKRGWAHVYDVVTGKAVAQLGAEADAILAAAISPDNLRVALGGSGKRLRVYDVQGGSRVYEVKNHNEWVMSADFSADGKYLVSCDRKGEIVVTEAGRGRNLHVLRGHRGTVHAVRCSPSRQLVASVGEDGTLRLWQLRDGKQRWSRRASAQAVLALAFGPKDLLASSGADGQVRTWDLAGRPRGALPANGDWVYALGFEARGQLLFTGDWQGRARVLDVRRRRRIASFVPSVGSGD
ncbi:MAG: c-type cytochrome domain-containing protein, partial [Planctomycetota bacterium]